MMNSEEKIKLVRCAIDKLLQKKERVIVALDGRCASGKTTVAEGLKSIYGCNVFHMDDFFLRAEQRTKERYNEVGGNVDYERFSEEVLTPLIQGKDVLYRKFDFHKLCMNAPVRVKPKSLNIVEGSYSMHPSLAASYDLSVFSDISPEEQKKRILIRNRYNAQDFFDKWIPLEEKYFIGTNLRARCDIII